MLCEEEVAALVLELAQLHLSCRREQLHGLHIACWLGLASAVKVLAVHGDAALNLTAAGCTPVHIACHLQGPDMA